MIHRDNSNTEHTYAQPYPRISDNNLSESEGEPRRSLQSTGAEADDLSTLSPEFREYLQEAERVFGTSLAFGFIDSTHNVPQDTPKKPYGWSRVYIPVSEIKPYKNSSVLQAVKHNPSRISRVEAFNFNLINDRDVCAWFYDLHYRQNNTYNRIRDKVFEAYGRWSLRKPAGYQVRKRLKNKLETIDDPLLLTLTVHQPRIEAMMPRNTNMDPVIFSILHIGSWTRTFLVKLRKYQERHRIDWRYIGWVLEFQQNGFPHIHILMAGNWLGNIKEIAAMWPHSEPEGVDYMNRAKLRRKFGGKDADPLRVANYIAGYVSQGAAAVVNPGDKIGKGKNGKTWAGETAIHRGYAYLAYFGGRIFNLAHEKRSEVPL